MTGAVPVAAVRPATDDDIAFVVALAERAASTLEGGRGAALMLARETPPPTAEQLALAVQSGDETVLVGTLDDVPVGAIAARVERLPAGVRLAVVTLLFVDEEARSVSVGEGLLNAIVEWARQKDCGSVDAYALPGERITKNFFEAAGFKARLLTVHHDL
ncbi:MAG: GNAT family N-acetyltransferase [Acidimicrobiales bacterium]|nr:GNAT family N-acetyltransferase [Acidimicrobiales bacterium]